MIISGILSLKCDNCKKQHDFPAYDSDFDLSMGNERQMGTENGYSWEHEFECDECGNEIEIYYEVWEYPVGAFNNDILKIKGGTELTRYVYEFTDEPDDDY